MKRSTLALVLFGILALALIACVAPSTPVAPAATLPPAAQPAATDIPVAVEDPAAGSIVIVDALGREVTLPAAPRRIVLTGRALFMIADAAYLFPDAGQRIVGIGSTAQGGSNFIELIDPNYADKAVLEREAGAEQVAALQPDLVMLKSSLAESLGQPIETLGIPVIYIDFETPEQYMRDLAVLGQVFQDEARAAEVAAFYQDKVAAISQAVADAERPRTLVLYYNDRDGAVAFNVPPMSWIQTEMVQIAGGEPVWADANPGGGWTQVTLEQIAAWDPDRVFVISYFKDPSEVVEDLKADANWQALRAMQEDALYAFPGDLYSWDQPDPRWILGLTWLAGRLHPDIFADQDMVAEVQSFYETLYNLDADFFQQNIAPTFQGDLP